MAPVSTKTVFLVRHGEALHNIEEKKAQRLAAKEAEADGHEKGCAEFKLRVDNARRASLHSEKFRDAQLSEGGKEQALLARQLLQSVAEELRLPLPSAVHVSPLRRTLQTAALMFPWHPAVEVRTHLQERRTGMPCDEPSPKHELTGTSDFSHMNFGDLNDDAGCENEDIEDAAQLRVRTSRILQSLFESEDEVLGLVTHKGVLRELERGPLGRADATEFDTCEVRVYDISCAPCGTTYASLRYSKAESCWNF